MNNQRGNHWKRRVFRQIVSLGTVPSLFAGALFAAPPSVPGLPGLPSAEPPIANLSEQPQLLPIPQLQPGSSLRPSLSTKTQQDASQTKLSTGTSSSFVNIKILPGLPPAGLPTNAATDRQSSAAHGQDKGTVHMKMQHSAAAPNASPAPAPLPSDYAISSATVTPSTPLTIKNEKTQGSGPVKLSIGDSGIVDLGVQRPRQETVVASRTPELVKPKKYSISQPVVLAQAAEIQSFDNASPSLPVGPSQPEPQLFEPNLPSTLPKMVPAEEQKPVELLSNRPNQEYTPDEQLPNESSIVASKPTFAKSVSFSTPDSSRTATAATETPSMPVAPSKPAELTASQLPTKATTSQGDLALRQYALRNAPEKTYQIESQGTYSIDAPFTVASIASLDSDVCTVFINGNSVIMAGGSTGNTRVAIASQSGETRLIEVNVLPVGQQFSRPQSEIDQVKELIGKVFPDARVQILSLPTGEVEVKGTASTESDARKILELVRKVCLVPVHDRLKSGR